MRGCLLPPRLSLHTGMVSTSVPILTKPVISIVTREIYPFVCIQMQVPKASDQTEKCM